MHTKWRRHCIMTQPQILSDELVAAHCRMLHFVPMTQLQRKPNNTGCSDDLAAAHDQLTKSVPMSQPQQLIASSRCLHPLCGKNESDTKKNAPFESVFLLQRRICQNLSLKQQGYIVIITTVILHCTSLCYPTCCWILQAPIGHLQNRLYIFVCIQTIDAQIVHGLYSFQKAGPLVVFFVRDHLLICTYQVKVSM